MAKPIYREPKKINYDSYEGLLLKRLATQSNALCKEVSKHKHSDEAFLWIEIIEKLIKQYKIEKY